MKKLLLNFAGIVFASCITTSVFAQTTGTLTFTFTPVAKSPCYSGTNNVVAIWIEDGAGAFVKTKIRNVGGGTADHLPNWTCKSGGYCGTLTFLSNALATTCNTTDATTGATLSSFTAKSITWDGKSVNGTTNGVTVADGTYQVVIQETWNHGGTGTAMRTFTFTKGPNSDIQTPAADANFTGISLQWIPTSVSIASNYSEMTGVSVYPNPSNNGIFNVNFEKATTVKVVNMLGVTIYNEKLEQSTTAKRIDLSTYANGIYFVYILDGDKSSIHRVVLNQ